MKNDKMLNLYGDYLISTFGQTTATGLSALLNGEISHDSVQRFLAEERKTSADLWRTVKPYVREIENEDGVIIVDDSICEKPYTALFRPLMPRSGNSSPLAWLRKVSV
jgi:hypothetical protein